MKFTMDDLPGVRRFTAAHGRSAGLAESALNDFVLAVNEVATNAVRYGSRVAELRIWPVGGELVTEVTDTGVWRPDVMPGGEPPPSGAEGGMGLWVTRQICSNVEVETGTTGTVVRLRMPVL